MPEKSAASSGSKILPVQGGTTIGRYKLLQQIGEGGFGVVFMAEQTEPVQRKVALKVIKAGMDTREVILRFEAERQALALMDHPNIAKIYDAGSTERPITLSLSPSAGEGARKAGEGDGTPLLLSAGRPYFVMELVRGLPITAYCDQYNLSTRERLGLFIKVCRAVQHAHQKGVIHRDLKPSNVLVTLHDGEPVPKVIDFGVAKALGQKLTDKTLFTRFEQLIGTPAYMSPEQAALSGLDIDTRSDIYSLGVVLYELLTGVTPFVPETLRQAALDEIRRIIQETPPPKPSTRLTDLVAADIRRLTASPSEKDKASLRRLLQQKKELISAVRGDLDWITMKALEKDRRRRYETVTGLASDLEHHLNHEPVLARPPSALYRLERAARRHRGAFAAATAVAVTLVLGVILSTCQAARATRAEALVKKRVIEVTTERDEKDKARKSADAARQDAEAISTFLTQVFRSPDATLGGGRSITVAASLDAAAEKLEKDLSLRSTRRATLQATIAKTYHALGLYREASALLEKVLASDQVTFGPEHPNTLATIGNLAYAYLEAGRLEEALKLGEELVTLRRKVEGPEHRHTLDAMHNLAMSYDHAGRREEARKLREELLPLYTKLQGPEHPDTLDAMHNLAISYADAGRREEAVKLREEVLMLRRKVQGPEHPDTHKAMANLASSYADTGRREEALKLREEELPLDRKVLGPEHPETLAAVLNLAISYDTAGRREEALKLREEVLPLHRKVLGSEHPQTLMAMNHLANSYDATGRRAEALKLREEQLLLCRNVRGPEHRDTIAAMHSLANSYHAAGHWAEALKLHEELLPLHRKVFGSEHSRTLAVMNYLANSYHDAGRGEEALKLWEEVVLLRSKVLGPETLDAMNSLAIAYDAAGRRGEALKLQEEVLILRRKVSGPEHPRTLGAMNNLANSYQAAGRLGEAFEMLEAVLALRRKVLGPDHRDTLASLRQLAEFHIAEQRYAEAEPHYLQIIQSVYTRYPSTNENVVSANSDLAGLLHDWAWSERGAADKTAAVERAREAERLLRDCLATRTVTLRPGSSRLADTRTRLGGALVALAVIDSTMTAEARQSKLAEAETLLLSAYQTTKQPANRPPSDQARTILEFLVQLYKANGDDAKAAEWKKQLDGIDNPAGAVKDATAAAKEG